MEVKLEKVFAIAAPAAAAWRLLSDVKGMAECMPGAQITEQVDATHYNGQVTAKLGPASAAFKGTLEVKSVDVTKREIHILGKGMDAKGGSAASMDLTANVRDTGNGSCELVGVSVVTVSGRLASFGGRMMVQVSDQILKQFGANFANRAIAAAEGTGAAHAAMEVAEQPRELNAFALLWSVMVDFIKSLFGRKNSNTIK
jgi:carbon monoxide dehydrogenase subunit G